MKMGIETMAIRIRKGIHRKPYQVRYRDAQGRRRSKQFRLKKDADAWSIKVGSELQEGVHVPESQTITIAEAGRLWIASIEAADPPLQRVTIQYYKQLLKNHITPFIGWTLLSNFTLPMLTAFDDRLREAGRSSLLRRKVMVSLSILISNAQQRGLVARNVVRDRKRSFGRNERKRRLKVGVDIPSPSEISAILTVASGRWRPVMMTLIFTGLRASELRGLRWQDVDLDARTLHVRQRADYWGQMDHPKSESGERSIPLSRNVVNALREWKLACPTSHLDLVFPSRNGTPLNHANIITRCLVPILMKAGICVPDEDGIMQAKYKGLHCFRHFYASWCLNRVEDGGLGLPYKTVQSRLGHSTMAMTVDTYSHLFPEQEDHAVLDAGELRLLGG